MPGISFVTPLSRVNRGGRRRNWDVLHYMMTTMLTQLDIDFDWEWIIPEQGSSQGDRWGCTKVSVYGNQNGTRAKLRNIGWQNAKHEMICHIDSDIVLERKAWVNAFKTCWDFDCYSPYARGIYLGERQTRRRLAGLRSGEWQFRMPPSRRWNLCGGICLIRREVMEKCEGWDERFNAWGYEDIALEKLMRAGGFRWKVDHRHIAIHMFHSTTPGKRSQRRRMLRLYRREYANRSFKEIMSRRREQRLAQQAKEAAKPKPEPHLGGHCNITHVDSGTARFFFKELECRSMLDVGCGPGGQVQLLESAGWFARGVDGDDTIERQIPCEIVDFTKQRYNPGNDIVDLVWCVEFVEHVRERFIDNYMPALQAGKYLLLTHALPGKNGHHHVNCRPPDYWKRKLAQHGLVYCDELTHKARQASTMRRDFVRETGMVFINENRPDKLKAPVVKRALIYRGGGNNIWAAALTEMLNDRGYSVDITTNARKIKDQDEVIIWNGQLPSDQMAIRKCQHLKLNHCFLEVGYFGQKTGLLLSRHGSTGGALFSGETFRSNTPEDEQYLNEFFQQYALGRRRETGSHILVMLQVQTDTAIKNYSPFKSMQQLVNYVEKRFPTDEVRIKAHPLQADIELRTRYPIIRSGSLWDHLLSAKLCVGINSTSLYEAILAGVPTMSLGGCVLQREPNKHREIVRELLRRQIPLEGCDDFDERVRRSLGRSF